MYLEQTKFDSFIQQSFSFLKNSINLDELIAKSIPIEKGSLGFLIPVSTLHIENPKIKNKLEQLLANSISLLLNQSKPNSDNLLKTDATQLAFFLVDKYQNETAYLLLGNDKKNSNSLCIESVVLFSQFEIPYFSKVIKTLTNYLDENYVISKLTIDGEATDIGHKYLCESSFVSVGSGYQYKAVLSFPPEKDILTAGPTISAREATYALDATRYGWNSEWAKYIKKFETSFASYIGTEFALSTSSCTGALHIALKALNIGPGDEVIVPEMTWVATASAIKYVGATPVFCDIDESNWCIDTGKIEKLITPKTKCIIPVHVYGHPADMDQVMEIANKHKLYVIEDAAPSIGAECRGKKTGSFGHFACFSFQGAKLLVTGEGGMLVTNDPELYKRAYAIWDHGRTPGTFWINEVGLKYKMANALAAIGLGQLERVEEQIRAKRRIFSWYESEFNGFEHIRLWKESEWARSIYWMSSLVLKPSSKITREDFFKELKKSKVDTRPTFPAISQYSMWEKYDSPIAQKVGNLGVNLPSGVCLKEDEVRYVAQTIKKIILQARGEL